MITLADVEKASERIAGRVIRTPSKWQARQPIYRSAADGWRRYAPYLGPLSALSPDPR